MHYAYLVHRCEPSRDLAAHACNLFPVPPLRQELAQVVAVEILLKPGGTARRIAEFDEVGGDLHHVVIVDRLEKFDFALRPAERVRMTRTDRDHLQDHLVVRALHQSDGFLRPIAKAAKRVDFEGFNGFLYQRFIDRHHSNSMRLRRRARDSSRARAARNSIRSRG